ncbi:hypothetical protein IAR50_000950 [Cryptococcus sp. DSM 104548]
MDMSKVYFSTTGEIVCRDEEGGRGPESHEDQLAGFFLDSADDFVLKDIYIDGFDFEEGEGPDAVVSRLMKRHARSSPDHMFTLHLAPRGCTVADELPEW